MGKEEKTAEEKTEDNPEEKQEDKPSEINLWKATKTEHKELEEFRIPRHLIRALLSTGEYKGLIFHGEGGLGKTFLTLNIIKKSLEPEEWEYKNGYTTALSLYRFLYENRERKVIILDDVEGIFNNSLSMSLLKSALWDSDGQRIVQYHTTSEKAEGLPSCFLMKAKVIILCNRIPNNKDISVRAMISRTIQYEVGFTYAEKLKICGFFLSNRPDLDFAQVAQVMKILKKNTNEATKDFNFRTLQKAIAFVKYDSQKAEELFCAIVEQDEVKLAYMKAVRGHLTVKGQIAAFTKLTNKSRATFFRVKKSIKVS